MLLGGTNSEAPLWIGRIKVLLKTFEGDLPHIVTVRSTTCQVVVYVFLDAPGSSFGSTLLDKCNIEYRIGTLSSKEDINSSN